MAEYLLRRTAGGFCASETCVVLILIAVRLLVVAACLTYGRRMPDKPSHCPASEAVQADTEVGEVNELVRQLPQARNTAEIFGLFLEQVEKLFPFIMHASVLLLPKDIKSNNGNNASHGFPFSSNKNGNGNKSKQVVVAFPPPDNTIRQFVEKVLAFRPSNNLDWTNCCVFNLYKGRGPVVQSPPQWPVSCAAAYHSGVVVSDVVSTPDYAERGPHFLDWKALHEKGAKSMVAVPMYSCKQVVAVLCLASSANNAFDRENVVSLLASVLAPYARALKYTTRRMEMQKLVNDIITPLAANPNQKNQGDCGAASEEVTLKDGRSGHNAEKAGKRSGGGFGGSAKSGSATWGNESNKGQKQLTAISPPAGTGSSGGPMGADDQSIKRVARKREPAIRNNHMFEVDHYGSPQDLDLDWGDFFFNLVSMCIVYVYFTKAAKENGETPIAILLCMGVAAFDIVLLLLRWLWFEQYIHYGSFVLYVFQIYRVVVVPVANTWMSWRVLCTVPYEPDIYIVLLLGFMLVACVVLGVQVCVLFLNWSKLNTRS
eukprot:evm.model.scf_1461EXC.1 EVM.evm.TU.scf_1461EXC.1   scf_1461EXC:11343-17643(-)